ncbi:MAG TPA: c-type cytochrome [Gaiellaceae bacterium]|nr:c-type cytochrome [Gaiellaceae bacterium]
MPRRLILLAAFVLVATAASNGKQLYGRYCAKCHDTLNAPSLHGVGAQAADFYLRSGYMPLPHLGVQPRRARVTFTNAEIESLVGYVASLGQGPAIPSPQPQSGSLSAGMQLFADHCAGCHQIMAEGGYVTGAVPPALGDDTATQIAEAVRIGPYVMPRFSQHAISNGQLNSIIRYIEYTRHPDDRGGWSIGHIGPVPEGLVTWFIALLALVCVTLLLARRHHA